MEYDRSEAAGLVELGDVVSWEDFRLRLEDGRSELTAPDLLDSSPRNDVLVVFRAILFAAIFELSDDDSAYMVADRRSVRDFVGLDGTDEPPTARWLRIHRIRWTKAGAIGELVADVDNRWARLGYRLQGLRDLMGASVAGSKDDGGERARPEVPGSEPELRARPKKAAGKRQAAGRKKAKRRRRRKKKGKGRRR